ncbi:tRNA-dihydrouridine synthase [Pedobacter fastidiosus]|uniref:NADH:flavin oxidoreductase n=1 Tax=Pedobacter fastidiosus TaxID=2765361 RepID=A0ABR7KXS9_9SPHI|nr:NADH:flavin oxidoreductase [Pedobacter fastidiosus]MBC6112924.1 NADH:flavin oxidoreductase [Pedobacter fastidiosus]
MKFKKQTKKHPFFQKAKIWQRELINRTVVAPMSRVSATEDGLATDEMMDYYSAFATGGFGVIITEGIYTDVYGSKSYDNQPGLTDFEQCASWGKITQAIHHAPTLVFAQLMHGGALSQNSKNTLAPSAIKPVGLKMTSYGGEGDFNLPKEMDLTDIQRMQQGFINGAINAHKAGFDGVEIHCANGYLLDQFLTPELNHRKDLYGGLMQNRFRVIAEIIDGIRNSVPKDFIVGLRVSEGKVNNLTYRWANGIETAKELAKEIKASLPDFVHVAVQTGEWERDSFYGDGISLASVMRKVTGLPVIANGGFHNLCQAESALNNNHADLLAIGKAALADPNWVVKTFNDLHTIPFHQDMLWPEANITHTQKIIQKLNQEKQ